MNDALVAPLLRLKDNMCHLEETERILKQHQKFSELIILYERNRQHKKGLFQNKFQQHFAFELLTLQIYLI